MRYLVLILLLLPSLLKAQEPDSSSALFSMREAERNFAKASVIYGRNTAFIQYFSDECVVFTDKWITNGKQFMQSRKAVPLVLKWEPEFMDIALSGDFGISTGPWETQEYRPGTTALASGYYLTVWKKEKEGWKAILDGGSGTPLLKSNGHHFTFPQGEDKTLNHSSSIDTEASAKALLEREKAFMSERIKDPSSYLTFFTSDSRMQLNGHLPSTDVDSINSWISRLDKNLVWDPKGSGAAVSGDLGYTYGMLIIPSNPVITKGHYVRIWKKKPGIVWQISLEMLNTDL